MNSRTYLFALQGTRAFSLITSHQNSKKHIIQNLYRTMACKSDDDVIFQTVNDKGIITLNRPKALNSLNNSMVSKLLTMLKQWENEKTLVICKGAGDKAFCAGGDIVNVTELGKLRDKRAQEFFRTEYTVNGIIGTYAIPYIALIDGIVMGGGVGVSVHAPYRIATERTLFAMPETAIGLFPDVGGSYFLPRLGGKLGLYLALTGQRLKGVDVMKAGIATHYVDSKCLNELESNLLQCENKRDIDATLSKFSKFNNDQFSLHSYLTQINYCFDARTLEEIFKNLERDGSEWALKTLNVLRKMSPTSMKITIKELDYGSRLNLHECLQMEYRLAVNCLANKDFYEGVRALLIDKDKNPKWNPSTIEGVTDKLVNTYFERLPDEEELRHKL